MLLKLSCVEDVHSIYWETVLSWGAQNITTVMLKQSDCCLHHKVVVETQHADLVHLREWKKPEL